MAWPLSMEQAAALLKHRCKQIAYDDNLQESELAGGSPEACIPVLRYLFTGFSEALNDCFEKAGHHFHEGMSDEELVSGIFDVWQLLSPSHPLGAATVDKVLHPHEWCAARLLFTLQCVLICGRKHDALVGENEQAWMASGMDWTSTSPQQQFEDHPLVGTDSQRERSTLAWMAQAYAEQMATLGTANDGAAEQQAWIAILKDPVAESEGLNSSSADTLCDGLHRLPSNEFHGPGAFPDDQADSDASAPLLSDAARSVYDSQLARVRSPQGAVIHGGEDALISSRSIELTAQGYRDLMQSLNPGQQYENTIDSSDDFDDSAFDQPFISSDADLEGTFSAAATRKLGPV